MCMSVKVRAVVGVSDVFFFFSSRRRHTRLRRDWSSDVCSSDLSSYITNTLSHNMNWGDTYGNWYVLEDEIQISCLNSDSLTLWIDSLALADTFQVYVSNTLVYEVFYTGLPWPNSNRLWPSNYSYQYYRSEERR